MKIKISKNQAYYYKKYLLEKDQDFLKKYGEILFGDFRKKGEKDTKYEKEVFEYLKKFLHGDYTLKAKPKELIDIFKSLLKAKKDYDILQTPYKKAYRYIGYVPKGIKKEDFEERNDLYYSTKDYIYKAHDEIQSWSSSLLVTKGFTRRSNQIGSINEGVILEIDISDDSDLIFNSKFLNSVYISSNENELIRVSNKSIETKMIMTKTMYKNNFEQKESPIYSFYKNKKGEILFLYSIDRDFYMFLLDNGNKKAGTKNTLNSLDLINVDNKIKDHFIELIKKMDYVSLDDNEKKKIIRILKK